MKKIFRSYLYVKSKDGRAAIAYHPFEVCTELFNIKRKFPLMRDRISYMAVGVEFADKTAKDIKIYQGDSAEQGKAL